jgi:L-seryl-tRNA(Ser) seleniumtransferase
VAKIPGVKTSYDFNPNQIANHTVSLRISWDPGKISLTPKQVMQQLAATRPRSIRVGGSDDDEKTPKNPTVEVTAWQMQSGDEMIIANRLSEILQSAPVAS